MAVENRESAYQKFQENISDSTRINENLSEEPLDTIADDWEKAL